jgi:hypothetical protein
VRIHRTGIKQFRHPAASTVDLIYHSMALPTEGHEDLQPTVYSAEPGTPSADALKLLSSWAATDGQHKHDAAAMS